MKKSQILFAMTLCLVMVFSVDAVARPPRGDKPHPIIEKLKMQRQKEAKAAPKEKQIPKEKHLKVIKLKHKQ